MMRLLGSCIFQHYNPAPAQEAIIHEHGSLPIPIHGILLAMALLVWPRAARLLLSPDT